MKHRVDRAIERIKGYCSKVITCSQCRYVDEDGDCPFAKSIIPCDWKMNGQKTERES